MNKPRHKNTRVAEEIKQIKILLIDFKKARNKVLELAASLRLDVTAENLYPNTERTTLMKCELLDLSGLVQLKNSLVKVLGELFDKERQYVYQHEKKEAQGRLQIETTRQQAAPLRFPNKKVEWEENKGRQSYLQSMRSSRASELRMSRKVEIPFYKMDKETVETVQTKLDRISKFIASLKKSIKGAAQTAGCKFRTRQYLLQQEAYIQAKAELEKYLMREEEMERLCIKAIKKQLQEHFQLNATLSPDGESYLIKVPKPKPQTPKKVEEPLSPTKQALPIQQQSSNKQPPPSSDEKLIRVQAQAEADFQQIKVELERKSQNYAELFNQMNEAVQKGNQRLSELRQKRKQAFEKDDQLWDQL